MSQESPSSFSSSFFISPFYLTVDCLQMLYLGPVCIHNTVSHPFNSLNMPQGQQEVTGLGRWVAQAVEIKRTGLMRLFHKHIQ